MIQREEGDPRPPIVTSRGIRFGVGEGHDIFSFAPGERSFCKTNDKSYDAVVMRVLLVLAYYRPRLEIRSDGAFDEEWEPALNWFNTQVGGVCVVQQPRFYRPIGQGRFRFDRHA